MRLRGFAAVSIIFAVTGVVACGNDGPAASTLAPKIGCMNVTNAPKNSPAQDDVDCNLPNGTSVEIATFGSSSDQQTWISSQPTANCCAEGKLWAATVTPGGNEAVAPVLRQIAQKLGGHQVSGS